jgi:hypothetical protein
MNPPAVAKATKMTKPKVIIKSPKSFFPQWYDELRQKRPPYFRRKNGRVRARAEKMEALSKIDEYARNEGMEV